MPAQSISEKSTFLEEFSISHVEMEDSQLLPMLAQLSNASLGP